MDTITDLLPQGVSRFDESSMLMSANSIENVQGSSSGAATSSSTLKKGY